MQFGRVTGTIVQTRADDDALAPLNLTVILDTGHSVPEIIRTQQVAALLVPLGEEPLAWTADQYTQETIATDLALLGWEAFGLAAGAEAALGASVGRSSPTYLVRRA